MMKIEKCKVCGKDMNINIEEEEWGSRGDEKIRHIYSTKDGYTDGLFTNICTDCINDEDKCLKELFNSIPITLKRYDEDIVQIKNKYEKIMNDEINEITEKINTLSNNYNKIKDISKLVDINKDILNELNDTLHKSKYSHYTYTIYNKVFREANPHLKTEIEWLEEFELISCIKDKYYFDSFELVSKENFVTKLKNYIFKHENEMTVSQYRILINRFNEIRIK